MKITIIGAGAIGSVVAGYLWKAGENITLIGRDDQIQTIRKNGLRIRGVRDEAIFWPVVKNRMDEKSDWVIFAVKTQDMESACQENYEFLESAQILTTQNGMQADNILSTYIEPQKTTSSIVMFGATYIKPGEVTFNFEGDWIIGKPFGPNDPLTQKIAEVFKKAFRVVVVDDITGMKWLKLFINFNNCIPALTGKSMQETFADLDLCRLSILLLREGVDVVRKSGVEIVSLPKFPADRIWGLVSMPVDQASQIINKTLTNLSKEPLYGSILQSILRKRTSEIDFINGEVTVVARSMGSEAPLNRKVVNLVHEVEREGRFFSVEEIKKEFEL